MREYIALLFLCASLSCALLSLPSLNPYLIAIASLISFLGLLAYKCWDILEAVIIRRTMVIYVSGKYELSGSREAAVSVSNGIYHAAAAARIHISDGAEVDSRAMEDIIGRFRWPFRLALHVERLDMKGMINGLETSIESRNIAISRIQNPSSGKGAMRAEALQREISHLKEELIKIGSGGVPLKLHYYVVTGTSSDSRVRAIDEAKARIMQLSGMIDAVLHSKSQLVCGEELLQLMEINSFGGDNGS